MADISKVTVGSTTYNIKDAAVPAWAKESTKPTYTASEVGALPDTYTAPVSSVNGSTGEVSVLEPFIVTIEERPDTSDTSTYTYTKDKTYAEILAAINAKRIVICRLESYQLATGGTPYNVDNLLNSHYGQMTNNLYFTYLYNVTSSTNIKSLIARAIVIKSTEEITVGASTTVGTTAKYSATSTFGQTGVAVASAISGKQDTANLVTSLSSSSTDDTYPSAKCVYDAIPSKTSELTNDSGFITSSDIPVTDVQNSSGTSLVSNGIATLPAIPTVPTNVSAFTNDAGYLTSYTETDPTVPAWAKASSKPTYTASEVGALPDSTVIPSAVTATKAMGPTGYPVIVSAAGTVSDTKISDGFYLSSTSTVNILSIGRSHSEDGMQGKIKLGNSSQSLKGYTNIITSALSEITLTLPSSTGTLALTSQIPTVPTNVSAFTNDAGYLTLATLPIYDGTVV